MTAMLALVLGYVLLWIAIIGTIAWTAFHFIKKFW